MSHRPRTEWYPRVAATAQMQSSAAVSPVTRKGTTTQTSLGSFFRTVDRTAFSKEPAPVPSNAMCVRQE